MSIMERRELSEQSTRSSGSQLAEGERESGCSVLRAAHTPYDNERPVREQQVWVDAQERKQWNC